LRASEHPAGADSSGSELVRFRIVERKPSVHTALLVLCKPKVAGSIPARSTPEKALETGLSASWRILVSKDRGRSAKRLQSGVGRSGQEGVSKQRPYGKPRNPAGYPATLPSRFGCFRADPSGTSLETREGANVHWIWFIIVGAVVGALGRLIHRGRDPMGWLATIAVGVISMVVAAAISSGWVAFVIGVAVAVLLVAGIGWMRREHGVTPRRA